MLGRQFRVGVAVLASAAAIVLAGALPVVAHRDANSSTSFNKAAQLADWRQFRKTADHRAWNTAESILSVANVAQLQVLWKDGAGFNSSPSVANGVVYNGDGGLRAFSVGCRSDGGYCSPLWTGGTGYPDWASPAVGGGMVYMQSVNGLFAFKVNCRLDGGKCAPVWTGTNANAGYTSPTLSNNGWLYAATGGGQLQAYDTARCAAAGGTCAPDWVADMNGETESPPAVANGRVFIINRLGVLQSYAAKCGTGGATCTPIWSAPLASGSESTPAVANGMVYAITADAHAYAFSTTCGTGGATCTPVWSALLPGGHTHASPAVTDSTVYFVTGHRILAYSVSCLQTGPACTTPQWRSGRRVNDGGFASSPAIANGVLYIAIQGVSQANGKLVAFKADCGNKGHTCYAIWRSAVLGGMTNSSPAVSNGVVYVSTNGGTFFAFGLPPAP